MAGDLLQARPVRVDIDRRLRHGHRDRLPARLEAVPLGLHGDVDDGADVQDFRAKLDPALADPREIEKIVQQAAQMASVTADELADTNGLRSAPVMTVEHTDAVQDDAERIAQLLRQQGEKLVL